MAKNQQCVENQDFNHCLTLMHKVLITENLKLAGAWNLPPNMNVRTSVSSSQPRWMSIPLVKSQQYSDFAEELKTIKKKHTYGKFKEKSKHYFS